MDIISVLQLFGGVGLFLFGMNLMGSNLKKSAGSGLARILETLTTSKKKGVGTIKGWCLGTGVTAIIQSSAATTMMLLGFVNAGIMQIGQAIPVVLGANVGSTVTAQILRLGDLGSGNILLELLKPVSLASVLIGVGAFVHMFTKSKKAKHIAGIFLGLGILFYGMNAMEKVFEPLSSSEKFRSFFTSFENPLVGILVGLLVTAVIQSSSASVGILQALSATGSITYATAIPIIIGQNIGKCMTILLGSIGANKKAKRVAISYLIFNIFGAILFTGVIYGVYYTVGIPAFTHVVNRGNIANFHLSFNLITSLLLLPFSEKLSDITGRLTQDMDEEDSDSEFKRLDERLLITPYVALEQCQQLMVKMTQKVTDNFKLAIGLLDKYDDGVFDKLEENEAFIDKCETSLSGYIIHIDRKKLSSDDKRMVIEMLNSIGDIERLGDHMVDIAYSSKDKSEGDVSFSEMGAKELACISEAVEYTMQNAIESFTENDTKKAYKVEPLCRVVEKLKDLIKTNHVERLQLGECSIQGGVILIDILSAYERIAAHSQNIALHVIKRTTGDSEFDEMHGHLGDLQSEEYKAMYAYYKNKYIQPVKEMKQIEAGNA